MPQTDCCMPQLVKRQPFQIIDVSTASVKNVVFDSGSHKKARIEIENDIAGQRVGEIQIVARRSISHGARETEPRIGHGMECPDSNINCVSIRIGGIARVLSPVSEPTN